MRAIHPVLLTGAVTLAVIACADSVTEPGDPTLLDGAFAYSLLGFDGTPTSFDGSSAGAWVPAPGHVHGDSLAGPGPRGGHGPGGPGGRHGGGFMGGLGGLFLGGGGMSGLGRGQFGDGTAGSACAFSSSSGRVECQAQTRDGITVTRSVAYTDAAGAVMSAFDSLKTNAIDTRVAVSGTRAGRDGATTTVDHRSQRTVSGLASGGTQRTVNGASTGRETTKGTDETGTFTAVRVAGDTVKAVVIPVKTGVLSPPSSGTVIRTMQVTVTHDGKSPTTSIRREVVTYDGTDTAQVVITKDGETTTCRLPLQRRQGPPRCE